MAQRWLVGGSQAARERAEQSGSQAQQRAGEAINKQLCHLQAQRFETPDAAPAARAAGSKSWRYHQVDTHHRRDHKRYESKGRPRAETPITAIAWQMQAHVRPDPAVIAAHKQHQACSVIGTNTEARPLRDVAIIAADKAHSHAEGGCRFLKAPRFWVSSFFGKKPRRMQGLLMGRT
jgi:hypothetical protein